MTNANNIEESPEAAHLLEEYKRRQAMKNGDFKRLVTMYFEAADEYTERTGKQPPPIIFNLNAK